MWPIHKDVFVTNNIEKKRKMLMCKKIGITARCYPLPGMLAQMKKLPISGFRI